MKKLLLLCCCLSFGLLSAQDLEGSWKLVNVNGEEVSDKEVVKIYQDGYFAFGSKEIPSNAFLMAGGGEYSHNPTVESSYIEAYDFHTGDSTLVGTKKTFSLSGDGNNITLISSDNRREIWERISDRENNLTGNWVITGRERNGELNRMTPGDRRTIKILGGDRFQWVAFNSATKEFSGTGGGTYTAEDGKYQEEIAFFSRDDSRVGASLGFDYEVKDGEWHHSGKSSKGDPIYEVWSSYREAYLNRFK